MNIAALIESIVEKFFSSPAGQKLIEDLVQNLLNKLIADITTAVTKQPSLLASLPSIGGSTVVNK